MVCVNEIEKCVPAIKKASPETFVLARITGHDWAISGTMQQAREWVRQLLPLMRAAPVDCWSVANEWMTPTDPHLLAQQCDNYRAAIDEGRKFGVDIAAGDWNTGHPHLSVNGVREAIAPLLREAKYVNIHYYARNGNPANDPDALLWTEIIRSYPHLKVIIGELGVLENDGLMPKGTAFEAFLRAVDERWRPHRDRLVGAALFTLKGYDGGQWEQCRWESDIERYSDWLTQAK